MAYWPFGGGGREARRAMEVAGGDRRGGGLWLIRFFSFPGCKNEKEQEFSLSESQRKGREESDQPEPSTPVITTGDLHSPPRLPSTTTERPLSSTTTIKPEDYKKSPAHYAVATSDHATLSSIISILPRLADLSKIHTESDSLTQEIIADQISSTLDRSDNAHREAPLHLAVHLNDSLAAGTLALAGAGADISLQNAADWNRLQEAI
ncbi:hypothetical protein Vadar_017247 [Vaccinium darrowii]|uniref:Uncharacterized protein n=1 Tax=Vaccinium darrowii TaxID=229202 RepID=A0ACB7XRF6_9ERIC|nr:hypothetical protein Vadar_017247 [Vaccinium darrowii]